MHDVQPAGGGDADSGGEALPGFPAAATRLVAPPLPPVRPTRVQIILFGATIISMLVMYPAVQLMSLSAPARAAMLADWPHLLADAVVYALTLLIILGVHEMGHFLVARHYRVDVSLPYFLPAPNLLGSFGAVIRMRSAIANRRALLMIGAAGPIAGFAVAVPAVIWGVALSRVGPAAEAGGPMIGGSLLFVWIMQAWHGSLGAGEVLELSGMAFAGWAGLFLTALNLLPIGQLDGGHVIYALLGRRTRWLTIPLVAVLLAMGVFFWLGWAVICVLVLIFGFRHPPVRDPSVPLDRIHHAVAVLALVILILCLTPVPIFVL